MLWVLVGLCILMVVGVGLGLATAPRTGEAATAEVELRQRTGLVSVPGSPGTRLVATRELGTVVYEHRSHTEGATDMSVGYWRLEPRPPSRVGLQLIERRLAPQSLGARAARALGDAVTGSQRTVTIRYAGPVSFGVPALDARFFAFADDPAVVALLAADAELAAQLLALAELDLTVGAEGVVLHDPARLNLGALMGPVSALETSGLAVARASIVAHERVIAMLERIAGRLGTATAYR